LCANSLRLAAFPLSSLRDRFVPPGRREVRSARAAFLRSFLDAFDISYLLRKYSRARAVGERCGIAPPANAAHSLRLDAAGEAVNVGAHCVPQTAQQTPLLALNFPWQ
jgi:hypothetical protein